MTKKERVAMIDRKKADLIAAQSAALDSIPENITGAEYDAVETEIFNRFQSQIDALWIERTAAMMPSPKNNWFLSAMAEYIRKADETGGKCEFRISPRQVEVFSRYASGIIQDGRHGRYSSIWTGADVNGHLITIASSGYLLVERYTA